MVKLCSELWVFGDRISDGMVLEIDMADRLGIPVHYYTDKCQETLKGGKEYGLRMEGSDLQS